MPLSLEDISAIERVLLKVTDPSTPEYAEFERARDRARDDVKEMIWAIEASEGLAPWQSKTRIADQPERWHLWPQYC